MALLLLLIAFQLLSQALAIEGPCSACRAIAVSLLMMLRCQRARLPCASLYIKP